jgi:hypothetical protein
VADEQTPNLGLIKPEVGNEREDWGAQLNHNFDLLDTAIGNAALADHTHTIDEVENLQSVLDSKADEAELQAVKDELLYKVDKTSDAGAAVIPAGVASLRPSPAAAGYFRFNLESARFEGFDGQKWSPIGGGATVGSVAPDAPQPGDFWLNSNDDSVWIWNGSEWVPVGSGGLTADVSEFFYTAQTDTDLFGGADMFGNSPIDLTKVNVNVYLNGVRLTDMVDWHVVDELHVRTVRPVVKGSVVIVEAIVKPQTIVATTGKKIDTSGWVFDGGSRTFQIIVDGRPYSPSSAADVFISIDGVLLDPGVDFYVTEDQVTFCEAPQPDARKWGLVGVPLGPDEIGTLYPAPSTYMRCTYAAQISSQIYFGGTDKFGVVLRGLSAPGAIIAVHINGVRVEEEEYRVVSDSEIALTRGVSVGSSVIVEVFEVASLDGSNVIVPDHNHDCGVF